MIGAEQAIEVARRYSKASTERLWAMAHALAKIEINFVLGDVVECGVWRGGHLIMARKLTPHRRCWGYDTFTGMTRPTMLDEHRSGNDRLHALTRWKASKADGLKWNAASVDEVRGYFEIEGVADADLVRLIAGDVADTLREPSNLPRAIALLRLDTDWHDSTKVELEVLYPLLQPGGVMIVDDYGHWQGARKAVDDYFAHLSRKPQIRQIDYTAIMVVKED